MKKQLFRFLENNVQDGRVFRIIMNMMPVFRSTGGKALYIANDFSEFRLKLPLNFYTKNEVGTLHGGHIYGFVDGIYMYQLMKLLGKDYVVWDKSATIIFLRPATKTLYATFNIAPDFVLQVKKDIAEHQTKDYLLHLPLKDINGKVYAKVDCTLYVASKAYYQSKTSTENNIQ